MVASALVRSIASRFGRRGGDEQAHFDADYYCRVYADVAASGVHPFAHFVGYGWREGRKCSATFDTLFYRDFHLGGALESPLTHWVAAGGPASGLATTPPTPEAYIAVQREIVADHFDAGYYRLQGGAAAAAVDPLGHYLKEGWRLGLSPSRSFDPNRYVQENGYVAALGVSPFYHRCSQLRMGDTVGSARRPMTSAISRRELRRVVAPAFDAGFYLARYADVRSAGLDPLDHYLDHGCRERRDPHPLFDGRFYLARNRDVAFSRMEPYYHYLTIGRAEGRRPNPVGTRLYPPMKAPDWSEAVPAADVEGADWAVVIPVYRGYDETLAAVHAVLSARQKTRFALHLINDCSPEPRLVAELERLAALGLFSFYTNPNNLGFVKTCNGALRLFADKEVVLLNADALVFGDWLDRIVAHARRDPTIATITPYSNNATICSYPVTNHDNRIEPELDAAALDRLAAQTNSGRVSDIPTGVGFCFFLSRASREAIGIFDEETFGRGYGEENDFCLRAAKAGFRNVLAEDIFAYHRGEVSFAAIATEEYGPGQKALHRKHPDYLERIGQHLRADPGLRGRMRLDLARLANFVGPRSIVFVTHALGGGIVTHISHLETRLREEGVNVVHLRVGVKDRWGVEIVCDGPDAPFLPNLLPSSIHQIDDLLSDFLRLLSPMAIHVHSLVDFDWRATTSLLQIVQAAEVPYYFTLHDYSVVCHRNNLVVPEGRYCGLPETDTCRRCVRDDRSYPEALDPAVRRDTYDTFLSGATAVFAPSDDIADRLRSAGASYAITVRAHEEDEVFIPTVVPRRSATREIVVIGAIGMHKGSRVLLALARDATARNLPIRFRIIGYSDISEELKGAGVIETGRYNDEAEAEAHVIASGATLMLFPSIWPETFCYALSQAFRLKLHPVVFDIGAQAARVRATGFGTVLPLAFIDNPAAMNDRLLAITPDTGPTLSISDTRYSNMLRDYYAISDVPSSANS